MSRRKPTPEPKGKPPFKKSVAREYLESIAVALILVGFIRAFVFQTFKIPTGSMETNLLIGDHLLVNKLVYSPSFGWLEDRVLAKKPVARGHVVVFKYPDDPTHDFVKRVIGLPGEKVEIINKQVYIDDRPIDEPYVRFLDPPAKPGDPEYGMRREGAGNNWGPETVPEDQLFVMGDNRDNSRDSRYWGFLPRGYLKGRALLVYWSYNASRDEYSRTGPWNWIKDTIAAFGKTRWRRFFHLIR